MLGKFAFAASVAALFALPRFTVQAQTHLQPRDILPTQDNSTQDHILPHDDLGSTSLNNTYSASGAKSKRRLVARDATYLTIPLTKSPKRSQYTGKISIQLKDSCQYFDVAFATSLFDHIFLINNVPTEDKFLQPASKKPTIIKIPAFGGQGSVLFYKTAAKIVAKIGEVDLGNIVVGALQNIKGFGVEVGDGVVPLARLAQHTIPRLPAAWQALVGPEAGRKPIIAFALRSNGGELHIGGIDRGAYAGGMYYYAYDQLSPFWAIKGGSMIVGEKSPPEEQVHVQRIIFDTTSQFIRGPLSMVDKLYNRNGIEIKKFHTELGLYEISCDTEVSIHLLLGDFKPVWTIEASAFAQRMPTHDETCFGLLAAHTKNTVSSIEQTDELLMGYIPMKDNYVVFDEEKGRIGIGRLKESYLVPRQAPKAGIQPS